MNKLLLILGSEPESDAAVARLVELADESTSVELLAIVHEPSLDGYLGNTEVYESLRQRLIDEESDKAAPYLKRIEDRGIEVVAKAVWDWPRGDAIRRRAFEQGAELIVLSFGLGGDRRIGARDWRFLAECPLPILVVNGAATAPYRRVVAAVDPVHAHAKPAALDDAVVRTAVTVSERAGARLSLVHCYLPLARHAAGRTAGDHVPLDDAEQALEQSRQRALDRLAADAGLDPGETQLVEGDPADVLAQLAERGDADLIVMGALSRGKLADFVIGSTAERLLHRAACDILLVKPEG
jgi:universal stress protein E